MTTAGDPSPGRLQQILEPGPERAAGAYVLHDAEPSTRPEHAPNFAEGVRGVWKAAEDEAAHDRIECAIAERQG